MIRSFRDRATEDLFHNRRSRRVRRFPAEIVPRARRKLDAVNAASELKDLRAPPGNQLEALKGDRKGFHSIRVNEQWRIVFRWREGHAWDVSLTDYH